MPLCTRTQAGDPKDAAIAEDAEKRLQQTKTSQFEEYIAVFGYSLDDLLTKGKGPKVYANDYGYYRPDGIMWDGNEWAIFINTYWTPNARIYEDSLVYALGAWASTSTGKHPTLPPSVKQKIKDRTSFLQRLTEGLYGYAAWVYQYGEVPP